MGGYGDGRVRVRECGVARVGMGGRGLLLKYAGHASVCCAGPRIRLPALPDNVEWDYATRAPPPSLVALQRIAPSSRVALRGIAPPLPCSIARDCAHPPS